MNLIYLSTRFKRSFSTFSGGGGGGLGKLKKEILLNVTRDELKLFQSLKDSVADEKSVEIRVAGGWVRNKVLESLYPDKFSCDDESNKDIDIALDNMNGEEFANRVKSYLSSLGTYITREEKEKEKALDSGESVIKSYTIKCNPEQSKHLATASLVIDGFNVDCNGLRSDVYLADSRIPMISKGTPMSDAHRRDITINTLFYNLHTGVIEDHTEKGLSDILSGTIRTPLQPFETLLEDPLRAFRAFRFATKYGFDIEPELMEAIKSKDFIQTILHKVSKERIYVEFTKMMQSRLYSERYFRYLLETDLVHAVFHSTDPALAQLPYSKYSLDYLRLGVLLPKIDSLEFRYACIFFPLVSNELINYNSLESLLHHHKSPNRITSKSLEILRFTSLLNQHLPLFLKNRGSISEALTGSKTLVEQVLCPLVLALRKFSDYKYSLELLKIHFNLQSHREDFAYPDNQIFEELEALIQDRLIPLSKTKHLLSFAEVKASVNNSSSLPLHLFMNKVLTYQISNFNFKTNTHPVITKLELINYLKSL